MDNQTSGIEIAPIQSMSISAVRTLPFDRTVTTEPASADDSASENIVVDNTPHPSTSEGSARTLPTLSESIELGEAIVAGINKAVHDIYLAHGIDLAAEAKTQPELQMPMQMKLIDGSDDDNNDSDENSDNSDNGEHGENSDKDPLLARATQQTMQTVPSAVHPKAKAAYEYALEIAHVFRQFKIVINKLPKGEDGKELAETASVLADVVVAGYHSWAANRKRLGEDAPYPSIRAIYEAFTNQCWKHAIASVWALQIYQTKTRYEKRNSFPGFGAAMENAFHACLYSVRGQESLAVTEAWADSMSKVLPHFVKLCAEPLEEFSLCNIADTYVRNVEGILESRKPPVVDEEDIAERARRPYANNWEYFAAGAGAYKKTTRLERCCLSIDNFLC